VRHLREIYTPALRFSLENARISISAGAAFLFLAALIATRLGSEFFPRWRKATCGSEPRCRRRFP